MAGVIIAQYPASANQENLEDEEASSFDILDAEVLKTDTSAQRLGIQLVTPEKRFSLHAWLRAQLRFSTPFDSDPLEPGAFADSPGGDFDIRRARIKAEGQLGGPKISFYFEHELSGDHPLLDLRLDVALGDTWHLRAGQYKVLYNRERVDSSGKQTFTERSIANYAFTIDRQRGVTLAKNFGDGTRANQWFMLGVFEGDGRNPGPSGDKPMYVARWQRQFLGFELPFSQSDLLYREDAAASFGLAATTVEGPYTRFSSSGGGQLDGFATGGDERYRLRQWLQEFAWHYRGIAIQQEYHVKKIEDRELGMTSTLRGGYAQLGKIWYAPLFTDEYPVEIAGRFAQVDWDDTPADRRQRELTLAGNLFINGHNNKLTVDVSRLDLDYTGAADESDTRWRVQWDVSF